VTVEGASGAVPMTFAETGFFTGVETPTVDCGDETQQNFELICSNELDVTTVYSRTGDATTGVLPSVVVTGTSTYDVGSGAADETLDYTVTTNNGGTATVLVAGSDALTAFGTKTGYDRATGTVTGLGVLAVNGLNGTICTVETTAVTLELCMWNTIVGTLTVGGNDAAGYRVDAVRRSDWVVVDSDVSTAAGVFSVDNLSKADAAYDLRLYNPSDTLISTSANVTVTDWCGATGVVTYTDGTWVGPTW